MVFLRLLSLSALALLASCWTPVFDENLSTAGLVRAKLDFDREFTVVMNNGNNDGNLFQTVESHDGQVIVVASSNHTNVTEFQYQGDPPGPFNNFSHPLDIPLSDPSQVILQPSSSMVGVFLPTTPNGSGVSLNEGSGNGAVKVFQFGIPMGALPFPDPAGERTDLIGFSTSINASQLPESFYLTVSATGATLWQNVGTFNAAPTALPNMSNIPYTGTPGWMAVDMSGPTIFFSHAPDKDGKYVSDIIDSSGLVASWSGHDHVVAFLSSGRLLTREGTFYNVCDSSGKILYSFPAGSLLFAGEYWNPLSSTMRSRFSESLFINPQNGGEGQVRVRIYSINTAKLDTLQ